MRSSPLNSLLALCLGVSLALPNGHAFGTLLFFVVGLTILLRRSSLPDLSSFKNPLWAAYGFFVIHASIMVWHGEPIKQFEYLTPFLLLPIVALGLFSSNIRAEFLWKGITLASITAGVIPLVQMIWADTPTRFSGFMSNPIPYGNICVLLATSCLVGLSTHAKRSPPIVSLGLALGLAFALAGTLLSGSKGGWVSIALTWPFLLLWSLRQMSAKHASYVITLLLVVSSVALFSPKSVMVERLKEGTQLAIGVATHLVDDETSEMPTDGSVGVRAAMWKHALTGPVLESKWLGVSREELRESQRQALASGTAPALRKDWAHLHNDSVDILATRGLLGLLALYTVWVVWLLYFAKHVRRLSDPSHKGLAMVGFLVLIQLAEFSLSGSQLRYLAVSIFAGFLMVAIAACLTHFQNQPNTKVQPQN